MAATTWCWAQAPMTSDCSRGHMWYEIRPTPYHLAVNPLVHLAKPFVPKLRIWMDGSLLGAPAGAPNHASAS